MEYLGNVGPDGYDEVVLRGNPAARPSQHFGFVRAVFWPACANHSNPMDEIRKIVGASHCSPTCKTNPCPWPGSRKPRLPPPVGDVNPPHPRRKAYKEGSTTMPTLTRLYEEQGQSPWLDNLTRSDLQDGTLLRLIIMGFGGSPRTPPSSPGPWSPRTPTTISSTASCPGHGVEDAYWELAIADGHALEVLRPPSMAVTATTASSRSRSRRTTRMTPRQPTRPREGCTTESADRTCWSRSPRRPRVYPPSRL